MDEGIINQITGQAKAIQKEKDNSLKDNEKQPQNENQVEVSDQPDNNSKNPMDNAVPQQYNDYKQENTSNPVPKTTDELYHYLDYHKTIPAFHRYDYKKDEQRVQRQQQAVALGHAFRSLAQVVGASKGAYINRNQPDRNFPRLSAELQRIREMKAADARSVQLENYRRGVMLSNLNMAAGRNKIAEDRNKIARENAAMNYDVGLRKDKNDRVYREKLAKAAQTRADAGMVNAKSYEDYRNKMAEVALQRAKTYDYNSKHHKPGKTYLSVDIGNEQKTFTKEDVNKIARKFISGAYGLKDDYNSPLPDFILNMMKDGHPLSDSESKELVKWMFYPKAKGYPSPVPNNNQSATNNTSNNGWW